jgi:hypothetical protein
MAQPTFVLPVAREESQRLSAADFPEVDFWPRVTSGLQVTRKEQLRQRNRGLGLGGKRTPGYLAPGGF